ncbi:MAG: enoyl-CoA hydratase/isomerase family protein [Acidobacteriota bacterium]
MSRVRVQEERGGAWLRVVLDERPGNLLSLAMIRELAGTLTRAASAPGLKWITLEGAGDHFSYGAKIQEHLPAPMAEVLPAMIQVVRDLLAFPAPTAALVRGRCLGGGFELALACDDILADADAEFGLPEVRLAAFPPMAAALLPARVGASRAARAMVAGDRQTAGYWHDAGLVSLAAPAASLREAAAAWFDRHFAPRSAVALAHAARAARLVLRAQAEPALAAAERQYLDELLATRDAVEGIQSWIDKRPPRWENE